MLPHKLCIIAAVGLTCITWGLAVDYKIDARLDPQTRIIVGTEQVSWTNATSTPATDLRFHLYFNAWKDARSSFLNSNRMRTQDFSEWREDEWAYTKVNLLVVPSADPEIEYDLTSRLKFIQPDDGNVYDETVLQVVLEEPVEPGQSIVVTIEFETKVPRTFARTGVFDDYYFLAHWFPKLGVFEEGGVWNCHQFIQTEFFSEFGAYDVSLNLPSDWVVGATGQLASADSQADGTTTHRFTQQQVHGFAWTASPRFQVFERDFTHPELRPVRMRLLMMPDHLGQEERYFAATAAALKYYGEWFGEYPYEQVTIVDPAYQSRSGGMEYPTLFTGGTRWWNTPGSRSPEGVTVHEYGHQIWYGVVANNEFEHAWLDEGFNSYSTKKVMETAFGRSRLVRRFLDGHIAYQFDDILLPPRNVSGDGGRLSELKLDRMSVPSWQLGPATLRERASGRSSRVYGSGAYGINSYTKPALMLETLERHLGWPTFQTILSTYFDRWKFKHPKPEDFFAIVDEVSGRDFSWFWEQTYHSSNIFDYAVDGVFKRNDLETVVVRRWGEAIFPVAVKVEFEESPPVVEQWDGKERWAAFRYQLADGDRVVRVTVDPERILLLDVNVTNNSWLRESPSAFAARKWSAKWMIWLQNTMQLFAFFG